MTHYSNDLDSSRLILEDLMFCLDDNADLDKASKDMKFDGRWDRVRGEVPNRELI